MFDHSCCATSQTEHKQVMLSHVFPYLFWYILSLHYGDLLGSVTHFKAAKLILTAYEYISLLY